VSKKLWPETVRQARRVIVLVVGLTLLLCGVGMLITPGPGWFLIFAGLSILALEFVWARHLLKKIKAKGSELSRTMFDSHKK
jgi:tellurite resistance protein TerC